MITKVGSREQRSLRAKEKFALGIDKVVNHYKMARHITIEIVDTRSLTMKRGSLSRLRSMGPACCARAFHPRHSGALSRLVLQSPGKRGAGLSRSQYWPRHPTDPPPDRGTGARPRVLADAPLLGLFSYAMPARTDARQRRRQNHRPSNTHEPRRPSVALEAGTFEDRQQAHRKARARPQLRKIDL